MADCPRCGREVGDDDAFCRHCGAALSSPQADSRRSFMDDMAADYTGRLKDKPTDPDALYNLALARYYGGQHQEAAEYLQRVIELLPDFADAFAKLAVCLWRLERPDKARAAIERAAELRPGDRRIEDLRQRMLR